MVFQLQNSRKVVGGCLVSHVSFWKLEDIFSHTAYGPLSFLCTKYHNLFWDVCSTSPRSLLIFTFCFYIYISSVCLSLCTSLWLFFHLITSLAIYLVVSSHLLNLPTEPLISIIVFSVPPFAFIFCLRLVWFPFLDRNYNIVFCREHSHFKVSIWTCYHLDSLWIYFYSLLYFIHLYDNLILFSYVYAYLFN